jgi:hypothetical protein
VIEVYEVTAHQFTEDGLEIVEYSNGVEVESIEEGIQTIFNEYVETEEKERDTRWHMMVRDPDTNEYLLFDVGVSLQKEVCQSDTIEEVQDILNSRYRPEEPKETAS